MDSRKYQDSYDWTSVRWRHDCSDVKTISAFWLVYSVSQLTYLVLHHVVLNVRFSGRHFTDPQSFYLESSSWEVVNLWQQVHGSEANQVIQVFSWEVRSKTQCWKVLPRSWKNSLLLVTKPQSQLQRKLLNRVYPLEYQKQGDLSQSNWNQSNFFTEKTTKT